MVSHFPPVWPPASSAHEPSGSQRTPRGQRRSGPKWSAVFPSSAALTPHVYCALRFGGWWRVCGQERVCSLGPSLPLTLHPIYNIPSADSPRSAVPPNLLVLPGWSSSPLLLLTSERLSCSPSRDNCLPCEAWQAAARSGLPQDATFQSFDCRRSLGRVRGKGAASGIYVCFSSGWLSSFTSNPPLSPLVGRHGSRSVQLPAEPPRPAAGPPFRLHPVSPDSARTLGPHLLPRPGLLVFLLLHLLTFAVRHLQLPGRRRPISRAAPPPPPPWPPDLPAAASPPASAPHLVARPADAVAWRRRAPRPLPPAFTRTPRQRARTLWPGPSGRAQFVRQHPQFGWRQHPLGGLLCAGGLWQADSVARRGGEEERQEEEWQFR